MKRKTLVGVRIGKKLNEWLSMEAEKLEISKSELIRSVLRNYRDMGTDCTGFVDKEWKRLKEFMRDRK